MTIHILFFAAYREFLGQGDLTLQLSEGATVADLLRILWDRGGAFTMLPANPVVAVNREFASLERELEEGDEVAFVPPVAGG